jgi:hypothetical protein
VCDLITLAAGALGAAAATAAKPKTLKAATPADPAVERAAAEADAQVKANQRLAFDQRRRREQGSLLAKGGPTFGDTGQDGASPLSPGQPVTRGTPVRRQNQVASLLGRGRSVVDGPAMSFGQYER